MNDITETRTAHEAEAKPFECGWKCGDADPEHQHYAVLAYEGGRLLGRLTPQGTVNRLKVHAAILSKSRAEHIAAEINEAGSYTAKAIPFSQ
jgi:hypothetical protein